MDGEKKTAAPAEPSYTCNEYREEMILLAMRRKLQNDGLDENERRRLREEIAHLEARMGMA